MNFSAVCTGSAAAGSDNAILAHRPPRSAHVNPLDLTHRPRRARRASGKFAENSGMACKLVGIMACTCSRPHPSLAFFDRNLACRPISSARYCARANRQPDETKGSMSCCNSDPLASTATARCRLTRPRRASALTNAPFVRHASSTCSRTSVRIAAAVSRRGPCGPRETGKVTTFSARIRRARR